MTQLRIKFSTWKCTLLDFHQYIVTQYRRSTPRRRSEVDGRNIFTWLSQFISWTHCTSTKIIHENSILCLNALNIYNYILLTTSTFFMVDCLVSSFPLSSYNEDSNIWCMLSTNLMPGNTILQVFYKHSISTATLSIRCFGYSPILEWQNCDPEK